MDTLDKIINDKKLILISGPCVIENEKITFDIAEKIKRICNKLNVSFIFKASYKKENRTKLNSFRGPGLEKGISILTKIKKKPSDTNYN